MTTWIARSRWLLPYFLMAAGLCVGVWVLMQWGSGQPPKPAVGLTLPTPSAEKPKPAAIESYTVAADLPRYLEIPGIKVPKSRVIGLGTDAKGQIATPNNLFDVGWYKASGKPVQAGAMFMYGHVSGWQANGLFYDLYKLKAGDMMAVTRGDNVVTHYKVVKTQRYPVTAVDMAAVLAPVVKGQQGLNLMTCAGKLDKATGEFSERLVVFATLKN